MHDRQSLIALHERRAHELAQEAIAATVDMDTEKGEEYQARADAARKAAVLLTQDPSLDACPAG